ncbi:hemocin immunity protein [Lonepinella sp. BR2474]|uniref:hemocin immunity protein n=1 Tax=Lonepinella sp. BR2474 TaxID=3434548 RepID=UPI003F6E1F49
MKGTIGPHEGKEFELMRNGQKNIALFYSDYEFPESFIPYIKSGTFRLKEVFISSSPKCDLTAQIVYKPEAEKEADLLAELIKILKFIPENEKKIGLLLGYSEEDVDFYVSRSLSRMKK